MPEENNKPSFVENWLATAFYIITLLSILGFFIQLLRREGGRMELVTYLRPQSGVRFQADIT